MKHTRSPCHIVPCTDYSKLQPQTQLFRLKSTTVVYKFLLFYMSEICFFVGFQEFFET